MNTNLRKYHIFIRNKKYFSLKYTIQNKMLTNQKLKKKIYFVYKNKYLFFKKLYKIK